MVLAPSLLVGAGAGSAELVLLAAAVAGLFVLVEYAARSPVVVDFRAAPPLNRMRFATLAATLGAVAVALGGGDAALSRLLLAVGALLGEAIDVWGSPLRALEAFLPPGTTEADARAIRAAAGLAYLVNLVGLTLFAIVLRLCGWPSAGGAFNLWINLPTFDPGAGRVVRRLRRDGAVNVSLGIAAPYLTPPLVLWLGGGVPLRAGDLTLVWVISLWAFLSATLLMRGIALRRLAAMIALRRRRLGLDGAADPDFLPA